MIARLERGHIAPKPAAVDQLARALGVSAADLDEGAAPAPESESPPAGGATSAT